MLVKVKDNETCSGIRWDKGSVRGPIGHSRPNISLTIQPIQKTTSSKHNRDLVYDRHCTVTE